MSVTARRVVTTAAAVVAITALAMPQAAVSATSSPYPWHTRIVATTFWVGEIFDPNAEDGSQVLSTYDGKWPVLPRPAVRRPQRQRGLRPAG